MTNKTDSDAGTTVKDVFAFIGNLSVLQVVFGALILGVVVWATMMKVKDAEAHNVPANMDEAFAVKRLSSIPGVADASVLKKASDPNGALVHGDYLNVLLKATDQCGKQRTPTDPVKDLCREVGARVLAVTR